jgi:FkbM family methyltransferase
MNQQHLNWLLKTHPQGFFVEAGAHDGVGDSQTLALERAGWSGICVEPSSAFDGLRQSRKCRLDHRALWKESGRVDFWEIGEGDVELSGIPRCFSNDGWDHLRRRDTTIRWLVPCVTLTDLLREHGAPAVVNFLCLDTEGSELDILTVHDFDAFRFQVILVEHNGVEERRRELWSLLRSRGFSRIDMEEKDDWYGWGTMQFEGGDTWTR